MPPQSANEIAAVASVHAAIELVESRFDDPRNTDPLSMLADCSSHCALVYGAGASALCLADPSQARVQLWFGAQCVDDVIGGNPAGDRVSARQSGCCNTTPCNEGVRWIRCG